MIIRMELGEASYDIVLERGCLKRAGELLNLDRKVLILTDEGVPAQYAQTVADRCREPHIYTVQQGEGSKSFAVLEAILTKMMELGFTRGDCVCSVGGGVVGDLGGFAAACYMRGIDFYNIPTTILSQVDSSIGGKTAVNLGGVKNIVGAFWQPKKVLIDPDTLDTLSDRQKSSGLAEAVKAGLIADPALFAMFEDYAAGGTPLDLEKVIAASLIVKKKVVEEDERESGVRKILNFGHTIGHGIESVTGLLHGECVAMGMIPMCSPAVRSRLVPVLGALHLPARVHADPEEVYKAVLHDKKMGDGFVSIVSVDTVGSYSIQKVDPAVLRYGIEVVVRL
ncbi:MAG: 3-dehydroquinate synthase [Lachnospiraceae bacterium]|nr:3-dehydroquinate synthase [Lachnospiraceae bacterium]